MVLVHFLFVTKFCKLLSWQAMCCREIQTIFKYWLGFTGKVNLPYWMEFLFLLLSYQSIQWQPVEHLPIITFHVWRLVPQCALFLRSHRNFLSSLQCKFSKNVLMLISHSLLMVVCQATCWMFEIFYISGPSMGHHYLIY